MLQLVCMAAGTAYQPYLMFRSSTGFGSGSRAPGRRKRSGRMNRENERETIVAGRTSSGVAAANLLAHNAAGLLLALAGIALVRWWP